MTEVVAERGLSQPPVIVDVVNDQCSSSTTPSKPSESPLRLSRESSMASMGSSTRSSSLFVANPMAANKGRRNSSRMDRLINTTTRVPPRSNDYGSLTGSTMFVVASALAATSAQNSATPNSSVPTTPLAFKCPSVQFEPITPEHSIPLVEDKHETTSEGSQATPPASIRCKPDEAIPLLIIPELRPTPTQPSDSEGGCCAPFRLAMHAIFGAFQAVVGFNAATSPK